MRPGTLVFVLSAVVGPGPGAAGDVQGEPREDETLTVLRLALLDVTRHGVGADDVVRTEAGSILRKAGVEVAWRRAAATEEVRRGEIRVILVDRALADRASGRPILGLTPVKSEAPAVVWVHVGSVRTVLGFPRERPSHTLTVHQRRDLGVALGRVVVHEVVHALAPAAGHGQSLMAGTLTRVQLTSATVPLGPSTARSVRAALRLVPSSPGSEPLLAGGGERLAE